MNRRPDTIRKKGKITRTKMKKKKKICATLLPAASLSFYCFERGKEAKDEIVIQID